MVGVLAVSTFSHAQGYASEALSMPCFAFKGLLVAEWGDDVMDGFTCQECGWPYWSHSHRLNRSNRRDKNVLIPAREARSYYNYARRLSYEGRGWRVGAFPYPPPDTRSRYDMMMDRTPGVCEFVAAVMVKERNARLAA